MKKTLQSAAARAALAWTAARYVQLVAHSVRWRIEGEAQLQLLANGPPVIVAFWHEALPAMPVLWLRAKRLGMTRPAVVLASRHRDGQLIGDAVRRLGIGLVSGSSSRGGAAGLRGLLKALSNGAHAGLTPDGPRGPRRVSAPGIAQLAALSGCAILPCGAAVSRGRTLSSWDRMRFPLPFGHGVLVCGPPITVLRQGWQDALPEIDRALNAAMDRAVAAL
ncbi:MAG: hypothetical protein B7Z81_05110 [Acidocella sp. 20-61-6]|nr:MAG: hypothetical protein B7Z81_05110 [Acidocella sp. 20-61-6]